MISLISTNEPSFGLVGHAFRRDARLGEACANLQREEQMVLLLHQCTRQLPRRCQFACKRNCDILRDIANPQALFVTRNIYVLINP